MAGFFDTLFGGGAEKEAAEKNRALTTGYGNEAQGYLSTGYGTGKENLGKALGAWSPLSDLAGQYRQGTNTYLGALGVGTPEQIAASKAAFTNAPGYEQGITAGLDVLNRRRAGQGMAASGNADIDALTFGQNTQNQQYNNWLQNLSGVNQQALAATTGAAQGQAATYGSLSDLAQQYAQSQTGVAGNVLGGQVNANNLQAAGEAAGAKNLLGAGLSLGSLALGGFGGGAGLGSLLGGLGGGGTAGVMNIGSQSFPKFS